MAAPWTEAKVLRRPLLDDSLMVIQRSGKQDCEVVPEAVESRLL
jgi:hypothetical protein